MREIPRKPSAAFRQQASSITMGALSSVIASGRSSGAINLSCRGLTDVPSAVYDASAALDGGAEVKWWEVAELSKLDLSRNQLKSLPAELMQLTRLITLDVSSNQLSALPEGLQGLSLLRSLQLSHNSALGPALPPSVASLPALVSLGCSNCGLASLPDNLGGPQQPALAALAAAQNALEVLPLGLAAADELVRLELQGNRLHALPGECVAGWASLEQLDLSDNALSALPPEVGRLAQLKALAVRNNRLAALPESLSNCASLAELALGFNRIAVLPEGLGVLQELRTLDLRNNVLQEVPEALCGLQLSLLDLTNCSLRALPPALGRMTSLRAMPLDGNPLKLIRRELWSGPISALLEHLRSRLPVPEQQDAAAAVGVAPTSSCRGGSKQQSGEGAGLAGLLELSVTGVGLRALPQELVQSACSLVRVDLSNNRDLGAAWRSDRGGALPQLLAQMSSLRQLRLANCGLLSWPLPTAATGAAAAAAAAAAVEGCLGALTSLELQHNPSISSIPHDACVCCPALRTLNLSNVAAAAQLPSSCLSGLASLHSLMLAGAGVAAFPLQQLLGLAGSLRTLDLSGNQLANVPEEVTQLTRLEELDLRNNQLGSLEPRLGLMAPTLRHLALEGNVLRTIRRPLLERGTPALLEYLCTRIPPAEAGQTTT